MKIKEILSGASAYVVISALAAFSLLTTSCENNPDAGYKTDDGSTQVQLTITTRAITSDEKGYVDGSVWENYIDVEGGDYRIYFFDTSNKFIGEVETLDFYATDTGLYTTYYAMGRIDKSLAVSDLKVVMLANWGEEHYPTNEELVSVSEDATNATTIDDICNAETAVFNAFVDGNGEADIPSESLLIPFYGVHEYTGIEWKTGWRINLSGSITLLRAVAKVEFILTNPATDSLSFDSVVLHGYNTLGYCAPEKVYSQSDYDSGYTDWDADFANTIHLVNTDASGNGANDSDQSGREIALRKGETSDGQEMWYAYLPEYDNSGTDYCYIAALANFQLPTDDPYRVYFANYTDGTTNAYDAEGDADDRFDVFRNNLYRFNVTLQEGAIYVTVQDWTDVFNNDWSFGEMSRLIYASDDINNFTGDDGYIYASLVEEGDEDNPTVYLQKVSATTTGYVRIPETVYYMGYTYTVVGIGSYAFDADQDVNFIDIPETVTYIESEAFHGDIGLEGIAVHSETPPDCAEDAFDGDDLDTIILYVPTNAVETYSKTSPWSSFKNIVGIDFVQ